MKKTLLVQSIQLQSQYLDYENYTNVRFIFTIHHYFILLIYQCTCMYVFTILYKNNLAYTCCKLWFIQFNGHKQII